MRNDFESNYLAHHGILGQKWGHKNGPPYPLDAGDHSASEKKAGYKKSISGDGRDSQKKKRSNRDKKNLAKELKSSLKDHGKDISAEEYDKIRDNVLSKVVTDDVKKTLRDKYEKFNKAFELEDEFYYSKEAKEASQKAYDKTFKDFEKNDPDYLKTIIKNNGGSKAGLDGFHDFRKVYEGYEDAEWSDAQEKYFKKHGIEQGASDKYYKDWYDYSSNLTKELVGKYGNMKIRNIGKSAKITVNTEVLEAIDEYSKSKKKK